MTKKLYLFTTDGCHLCEMALAIVQPLLSDTKWQLTLVEISEEASLVEQYGIRIPVLLKEGAIEDLGWPFDQEQVVSYLN
ncbi:Glutaredoxin-like domain [Oceanospirillum multiglobuliferum]|uniref:Thioredoxin family protein n=1 Tax=Oceanospirillum multiglobuliferum TaxID=64969 RepID=A0A1T4LE94_9GAMM|nr:glutaredoxin family protein [Oceanospirillum multiglobuliferum]OPX56692.1 hypothetical protein BTE48_02015 [Oceanospirillum multiglobuliferum]SJZ52878.1 Glutaredoxin-like domain [Oceanospirillum multiglobuliferum]